MPKETTAPPTPLSQKRGAKNHPVKDRGVRIRSYVSELQKKRREDRVHRRVT